VGESVYVPGTVTAIWDTTNNTLTLNNVEGAEKGVVTISWNSFAQVEDLAERVQSLVYVPTHLDGYARINYGVFNGKNVEMASKLQFRVYPAKYAEAIAANIECLSFDPIEVTKADVVNPALNVIAATADNAKGIVTLTVAARDFDAFYAANGKAYSAALILNDGNNERTSSYVGFVPQENELEFVVLDKDGKEITAWGQYEIPYSSSASVTVFDGAKGAIKNGEEYTLIENLAKEGFELAFEWSALPMQSPTALASKYFVQKVNENGYAEISLVHEGDNAVNGEQVGVTVTQAYEYVNADYDFYDQRIANVKIGKEKATIDAGVFETKWAYKTDAYVAEYTRDFAAIDTDLKIEGLPADVKVADLINNNTPVIAPADLKVALAVAEKDATDNDTLKIDFGFNKWAKHEVTATYALETIDVTLKFTVNAVDRVKVNEDDNIVVDLGTAQVDYERNLILPNETTEIVDVLSAVYAAVPADDKVGMTEAEWLKDVLVTNVANSKNTVANTLVLTMGANADAEKVTLNNWANYNTTNLAIAADGQKASANFTYRQNFGTEFIPNAIAFTKVVTTAYGQKITLKKSIEFVLPTYTFAHIPGFVIGTAPDYYSTIRGNFNETGDKITSITVDDLNLNVSFNIKNAEGTILDTKAMTDAGLEVVYSLELTDEQKALYPGLVITDNIFTYNADLDQVGVDAKLYLVNAENTANVNAKIELPTNYTDVYGNYVVKKFDPLKSLEVAELTEQITEPQTYTVNLIKALTITDINSVKVLDKGVWSAKYDNPEGILGIDIAWGEATIPAEYVRYLSYDSTNNTVAFVKSGEIVLHEDVVVTVPVKVTHTWGEFEEKTVKVIFKK